MIEFKVVYGQSLAVVMNCLDKFFQKYWFRISRILFFLFPVHVRDLHLYGGDGKQREAMTQAKVNYVCMSIYEIIYAEAKNYWAYNYKKG